MTHLSCEIKKEDILTPIVHANRYFSQVINTQKKNNHVHVIRCIILDAYAYIEADFNYMYVWNMNSSQFIMKTSWT